MHGPLREVCRGQTLEVWEAQSTGALRVAWSGHGHHSSLQYWVSGIGYPPKLLDLNAEIAILRIVDWQIEITVSV